MLLPLINDTTHQSSDVLQSKACTYLLHHQEHHRHLKRMLGDKLLFQTIKSVLKESSLEM